MLTVFRVETHKGTGMYNREWRDRTPSFTNLHDNGIGSITHPLPERDYLLRWYAIPREDRHEWFFGFATLDQLKHWTVDDTVRGLMDIERFAVKVFQVEDHNDVRIGRHQAIFRKHFARYVGSFPASHVDTKDLSCYNGFIS